jgi:glycosyltransferase involved in cell wall biosynthesis
MGKIIKSFKTIKSVCFIRETVKNNLWGIYKKSINYYLNRFYDAVFFISEYDYKNHNCKAPVTGIIRNTHRIDNLAINQSQFEARKILKLPTDGFFILFFGGFDKLKGTHVIVKALSNLKNDNIHLINVGAKSNNSNISIKQQLKKLLNKDYEKSILNIVDKYKLENKIHYTGKYFDTTVLFNACDVLVFPSTSPHQARPVFEAGFFKKPVIISDFKETSEYVTHNYNGLVFKPNDPFGLSNCIQLLKTNQDFCIKLGLNNYIKSSENHDYKVILEIVKKSFML